MSGGGKRSNERTILRSPSRCTEGFIARFGPDKRRRLARQCASISSARSKPLLWRRAKNRRETRGQPPGIRDRPLVSQFWCILYFTELIQENRETGGCPQIKRRMLCSQSGIGGCTHSWSCPSSGCRVGRFQPKQ